MADDTDVGSFGALGLTPVLIDGYRSTDPEMSVDDAAGLWVLGVTPETLQQYAALGSDRATAIRLWVLGVRPATVGEYLELSPPPTIDQVMHLAAVGVTPDRLADGLAVGLDVTRVLSGADAPPVAARATVTGAAVTDTGLGDLPVTGDLTVDDRLRLAAAGDALPLLRELPVIAPFSPEEAVFLAEHDLSAVVNLLRVLPVTGQWTPEQVVRLAAAGTTAVLAALPSGTPLTPDAVLDAVDSVRHPPRTAHRVSATVVAPDGRRVEVGAEPVTVGRLDTSTIRLPDQHVSRQHAVLFRDGDNLLVRDLGSTHGTIVNGELIREATLEHGDVLDLGGTTLTIEIGEAPTMPPPPTSPAPLPPAADPAHDVEAVPPIDPAGQESPAPPPTTGT